MRVGSVIKTPVRVKQSSLWGDSFYNEDGEIILDANLIAHTLNQHDALVDMVRGLRDELVTLKRIKRIESGTTDSYIREANELLKGEQ